MNYDYTNESGKPVTGTAAFLHEVYTVEGGPEKFIKNRENVAIQAFLDSPDTQGIIEERAIAIAYRKKIQMKQCK